MTLSLARCTASYPQPPPAIAEQHLRAACGALHTPWQSRGSGLAEQWPGRASPGAGQTRQLPPPASWPPSCACSHPSRAREMRRARAAPGRMQKAAAQSRPHSARCGRQGGGSKGLMYVGGWQTRQPACIAIRLADQARWNCATRPQQAIHLHATSSAITSSRRAGHPPQHLLQVWVTGEARLKVCQHCRWRRWQWQRACCARARPLALRTGQRPQTLLCEAEGRLVDCKALVPWPQAAAILHLLQALVSFCAA